MTVEIRSLSREEGQTSAHRSEGSGARGTEDGEVRRKGQAKVAISIEVEKRCGPNEKLEQLIEHDGQDDGLGVACRSDQYLS